MSTTENGINAPPVPIAQLQRQFEQIYQRFTDGALPALLGGPLAKDASVKRLSGLFEDTKRELADARPIPVAIVGETGVGKSTLLNALLETDFLPTGVVGSQTAAFITIAFAEQWKITCQYVSESELNEMFDFAWAQADDRTEAVSAEEVERARAKVRAMLGVRDDEPMPPQSDVPQAIRAMVHQGRRTFVGQDECRVELLLHAKKNYWPITRTIEVVGPFEMLRSGVVISDLPGAGDVNKARRGRAAEAILHAGQILIAAEARGLKSSLLEQLESDARLPHRLFSQKQPVQVLLLGTKLDSAVPDPDTKPEEIRQLGLDPETATRPQIFDAIVQEWQKLVVSQFRSWLTNLADQFLELPSAERTAHVDRIMRAVRAVPTNSSDWKRHSKGKAMTLVAVSDETGIPLLRKSIGELADAQNATTRSHLERRVAECHSSVLEAIQSSEQLLGADIQSILTAVEESRSEMEAIQDRYAQVIDDLRMTVLNRFQLLREKLDVSIESAANKMARDARVRVSEHLDGLHWMSLRATVRNDGRWTTGAGRMVNLRDNLAGEITRQVPQAFARLAESRLASDIDLVRTSLLERLRLFTDDIRQVVDKQCNDEMTRKTVNKMFAAGMKKAEREINEHAEALLKRRDETVKDMQARIDKSVDRTVAEICGECQNDSGKGWKSRSMSKISEGTNKAAEVARKRAMEVAEAALAEIEDRVKDFCAAATREMADLASDLPIVLKEAVERLRVAGPQQQRKALSEVKATWDLVPQ